MPLHMDAYIYGELSPTYETTYHHIPTYHNLVATNHSSFEFFGPFKSFYNAAVDTWMLTTTYQIPVRYKISEFVSKTYKISQYTRCGSGI